MNNKFKSKFTKLNTRERSRIISKHKQTKYQENNNDHLSHLCFEENSSSSLRCKDDRGIVFLSFFCVFQILDLFSFCGLSFFLFQFFFFLFLLLLWIFISFFFGFSLSCVFSLFFGDSSFLFSNLWFYEDEFL